MSGHQKTWVLLDEMYGAILCIFSSCFPPHLLQLFRRMLQCCFDVKLQKCVVDYKTSPDVPVA